MEPSSFLLQHPISLQIEIGTELRLQSGRATFLPFLKPTERPPENLPSMKPATLGTQPLALVAHFLWEYEGIDGWVLWFARSGKTPLNWKSQT